MFTIDSEDSGERDTRILAEVVEVIKTLLISHDMLKASEIVGLHVELTD